ncbi:MAG: DUF2950 domain-containing protein [Candidatus Korobacteraceae bacterium]|jgi:hypothetical protein
MFDLVRNRASLGLRFLRLMVAAAMLFSIWACNQKEQPPAQASPKTFASPDDAGKGLFEAAKSGNQETVLALFGPGTKEVIYTGNAAEDRASLDGFVQAYQVMNRWRKLSDGSELLLVGADNQAFPIPLKNAASHWYFDAAAGKEEILARRIGRDEIVAIDVCGALADAQAEYFSQRHDGVKQYAQKFISDAGRQNGLYWQSPEGTPASPLGPLVAFATEEGLQIKQSSAQPFFGYYFRRLEMQGPAAKGGAKSYVANGKMTGGFAYVAYPAKYGDTGIKTFIVSQDRVVCEKDLGKDTTDVAKSLTEFNPDNTWTALH